MTKEEIAKRLDDLERSGPHGFSKVVEQVFGGSISDLFDAILDGRAPQVEHLVAPIGIVQHRLSRIEKVLDKLVYAVGRLERKLL